VSNILIAYDTLHGSTAETAGFLGKELVREGHTVDVLHIAEVGDTIDYDMLIIGSPVVVGKWTDNMLSFIQRHHRVLSQRQVALFTTCLASLWGQKAEDIVVRYINPILAEFPGLSPVSIGVFGGVLDFDLYTADTKASMQKIVGAHGGPVEGRHDYRDWNTMKRWANDLNNSLGDK